MKKLKLYRDIFNILMFLLNIIFILVIFILYYDEIKIKFFKEEILYGIVYFILGTHLLYFLYLINECKNWMFINIFFNLLKSGFLFLCIYVLSLNISDLLLAFHHLALKHDIIYQNWFFEIHWNFTEEDLKNRIKVIYPEISKINSPLDEKIIHHILGNAKTMEEVERNVELYCQTEPTGMYQRISNYYKKNPEIIFLGCATAISILFVILLKSPPTAISDLQSLNYTWLTGIRDLGSLIENLVNREQGIIRRVMLDTPERALILASLEEIKSSAILIKNTFNSFFF